MAHNKKNFYASEIIIQTMPYQVEFLSPVAPTKHSFSFSVTQEMLLCRDHTLMSLSHARSSCCSQRTFDAPEHPYLDAAVRQFKNNKPVTVPALASKRVSL